MGGGGYSLEPSREEETKLGQQSDKSFVQEYRKQINLADVFRGAKTWDARNKAFNQRKLGGRTGKDP